MSSVFITDVSPLKAFESYMAAAERPDDRPAPKRRLFRTPQVMPPTRMVLVANRYGWMWDLGHEGVSMWIAYTPEREAIVISTPWDDLGTIAPSFRVVCEAGNVATLTQQALDGRSIGNAGWTFDRLESYVRETLAACIFITPPMIDRLRKGVTIDEIITSAPEQAS